MDAARDAADWLGEIAALSAKRRIGAAATAPFCAGLVGYVGYEALAGLEPSLRLPASAYALAPAQFGVYDAAATFDRQLRRCFISARNAAAADGLERLLGEGDAPKISLPAFGAPRSNFSQGAYEHAVAATIERIRNGDLFQANIAQTLVAEAAAPFSAFAFFRRVAAASDAFFAALFQYEDGAIASNSPERFFSLDRNGRVMTEPVKGTRPRGRDDGEDSALAQSLLADPKDRAENIMIADLMRNDLSRICRDHSIREDAICELMSLSRVHHLVSRISGVLQTDRSVADIFHALFPSGSITGAPKIEAMGVIAQTERVGRGPYCGAIGYIDDRGSADFSVAIRTMMISADHTTLSIPVGGGVTLRSTPADEFEETLVKARAALAAIGCEPVGA